MWNGELASTNLWYTYFNGVRRIVSTKITQGKGELTFKTTKKVIIINPHAPFYQSIIESRR